jgi:hypothetical protein
MVLVTGPINQIRSMLTGNYDVPLDPPAAAVPPPVAAGSATAAPAARLEEGSVP